MTIKEKLKLLGVTPHQMKNLEPAELQGLLDDKTLALTSTGQPLPWGVLPSPSGDEPSPSGDEPAPSGDESAPSGDEPAPSGDEPAQSGDEPAQSGESIASLDCMTTPAIAIYGFRGPAKDFSLVNGRPYDRGAEMDVLAGDKLRLGEMTYQWLREQGLIAKG